MIIKDININIKSSMQTEYKFLIEQKSKKSIIISMFPGDKYVFGRDTKCDYTIPDKLVSRIQATILVKTGEVILVIDGDGDKIKSRNGIFDEDGQRINVQKNMLPGDLVWIYKGDDGVFVKLTFVKELDPLSTTEQILIKNGPEGCPIIDGQAIALEIRALSARIDEIDVHVSDNFNLIGDVVDNELTKKQSASASKADFEEFKTTVKDSLEEISNVNSSQSKALVIQSKAISIGLPVLMLSLVVFAISGTIQKMENDEKKQWTSLIRDVVITAIGSYGTYKITADKKAP